MEKKSQEQKNVFKSWLETLQQESWQLELLISGLALFGVFEAKELLDSLEAFISVQFFRGSAFIAVNVFVFLLKGSWYIFLINLLIHIVLRGLWIGAIGLRYVSQDINYDELRFSNYFKKLYTRRYESFDDYIEDLEKVCSVIFAYTFLLFFILISACLFVIWPAIFVSFLGEQLGPLVMIIYILLGTIVFIDFIFLNPLKRIGDGVFTKIYGFVFRFYSTITLSFIFRPLLLNFLDNKFTKKLFLFSIPYGIFIIIILPKISSETIAYMPNFESQDLRGIAYYQGTINPYLYDDLRPNKNKRIRYASLREFRLDGEILEFFIAHSKSDENYFNNFKKLPKVNKVGFKSFFKEKPPEDSILISIQSKISTETYDFLKFKRENKESKSEQEWDDGYNLLNSKHNALLVNHHAQRVIEINNAFLELNRFYIDKKDLSSDVKCLITTHSNMGEHGWNCFIRIDSLENGIHNLKIDRGVYDRTNNVINRIELEIPFILDKN